MEQSDVQYQPNYVKKDQAPKHTQIRKKKMDDAGLPQIDFFYKKKPAKPLFAWKYNEHSYMCSQRNNF